MRVVLIFLLISNIFFLDAGIVQKSDQNSSVEVFDDSFEAEFDAPLVQKQHFDPLQGYNELMTGFNDGFYTSVLIPASKEYKRIIPKGARVSISNFFDNLLFPVRFVNNILQFKLQNSGEELLRFLINSTIGVLGLFDPAQKKFDLKAHHEDFGQTLGYYGVGSGFHVVLPFLGPSNLRDVTGLVADSVADPIYRYDERFYNITEKNYETLVAKAYGILNERSLHIGEYESLKKDALVLYPFLRDLYEQRREKLIKE